MLRSYRPNSTHIDQSLDERRSRAIRSGLVFQDGWQGEYDEARQRFEESLAIGRDLQNPRGIAASLALDVLVSLAQLTGQKGDLEQALELLAFITHHPASEQQTRDKTPPLRVELAGQLPAEIVAAAEARGRDLNLDQVAARILAR